MKYFHRSEFACKCGCGSNDMNESFLHLLDTARDIAGTSFVINSGYRCKNHNKDEGGKETSSHLLGLAVDIRADTSRKRFKILRGLIYAGFIRIGIGGDFIHVDHDPDKDPNVTWLY